MYELTHLITSLPTGLITVVIVRIIRMNCDIFRVNIPQFTTDVTIYQSHLNYESKSGNLFHHNFENVNISFEKRHKARSVI